MPCQLVVFDVLVVTGEVLGLVTRLRSAGPKMDATRLLSVIERYLVASLFSQLMSLSNRAREELIQAAIQGACFRRCLLV